MEMKHSTYHGRLEEELQPAHRLATMSRPLWVAPATQATLGSRDRYSELKVRVPLGWLVLSVQISGDSVLGEGPPVLPPEIAYYSGPGTTRLLCAQAAQNG